jgi:hypothetical protein
MFWLVYCFRSLCSSIACCFSSTTRSYTFRRDHNNSLPCKAGIVNNAASFRTCLPNHRPPMTVSMPRLDSQLVELKNDLLGASAHQRLSDSSSSLDLPILVAVASATPKTRSLDITRYPPHLDPVQVHTPSDRRIRSPCRFYLVFDKQLPLVSKSSFILSRHFAINFLSHQSHTT